MSVRFHVTDKRNGRADVYDQTHMMPLSFESMTRDVLPSESVEYLMDPLIVQIIQMVYCKSI